MKSTRNICSGLLMAIAVAVGISFVVVARTPRSSSHRVHEISGDSLQNAKKGQGGKTYSGITWSSKTADGYKFTYQTPEGETKNILISNGKVYEVDAGGNRIELRGVPDSSGHSRIIDPNGNINNYKIREDKDGVTVITFDDSKSNRTSSRKANYNGYDDPIYNDGKNMRRVIKNIGDFSAISASRAIKIVYTQSRPGEIVIEAPAKYAEAISLSNNRGVLEIRNNYRGNNINGTIKVSCSSTRLRSIDLSTACTFESTTPIDAGGKFTLNLSSASNVNIPSLKCQLLTVDGSSASTVKIPYITSGDLNLDLSSASNFSATHIAASGKAIIDLSSASEVKVDRLDCQNLTADCSSASKSNITNILATSADIDCSSASGFTVRENLICNGSNSFANLSSSSTASINISAVKAARSSLEAYSQSKVSVGYLSAGSVAMDVANSTIEVAGKATRADVSAGTMGYIEARNFDVGTADVEAARYAKVSIKAGHINYK